MFRFLEIKGVRLSHLQIHLKPEIGEAQLE